VFAYVSVLFGNWITRIPDVQANLGLGEAALGLALVGTPVGMLLGVPLTGYLVVRFGAGRITVGAALVVAGAFVLPTLAPSLVSLTVALAVLGLGDGALNVAMNARAAAVEKDRDTPIMSTCHGFFSSGGMLGAGMGSAAAAVDMPLPLHMGMVCSAGAGLILTLRRPLTAGPIARDIGPAFAMPSRALAGLAVLVFCVLLAEGAVSNWSAVYLRSGLEAGSGVAGLGYAAFSLAMAAGRFYGDRAVSRVGDARLVRMGSLLAALGLGGGLWWGEPAAAIGGFALMGLGYAVLIPVLFRTATRTPGMAPGTSLAAVASAGYVGLFAGPPALGVVAEAAGLTAAMGVICLLSVAVALLSGPVLKASGPTDRSS